MTNKPHHECPRFQKCSVNRCPLHPLYPNLPIDPEDRETKCTMEKQVRYRIGSKYPDVLKFQGLTSKEWAGKQRFDNLTEEERQNVRVKAKGLFLSSCQKQSTEKDVDVGSGQG